VGFRTILGQKNRRVRGEREIEEKEREIEENGREIEEKEQDAHHLLTQNHKITL